MTNRLPEQQLQEELLDEIGDFTKAITKKIGQGVGAVTGAGQKVKGVAKRSVDALGKSFQQGKQQTQKAVAGQDYKASQPKAQAQSQAATTQTTTTKNPQAGVGAALKRFGKGVAGADSYNYRVGTQAQQDANAAGFKSVAQQAADKKTGVGAGLQKADAEAKRKAGLEKKLGTTGAGATATNTAKNAVDKSIARNQKKKDKQSAMKQGIDQAQIDGANQGIANMQKAQVDKNKDGKDDKSGKPMAPAPTGKGPSSGAGGAAAQVDANKDGKDDKTGKPMSKTATDVKNKTGLKAGGVLLDPNNPEHKALIASIEKASPGLTKTVNKLDAGSKGKLLKGLQAA
jgi:hypothetical protein